MYNLSFSVCSIGGTNILVSSYNKRLTAVTGITSPFNVYRNCEKSEILRTDIVSDGNETISVDERTPMEVLGTYASDYYVKYISAHDSHVYHGFVPIAEVDRTINETVKRGYILIAEDMATMLRSIIPSDRVAKNMIDLFHANSI